MALSKYSSYDVRLATLRNWPGRIWCDIGKIARAGLYYLDSDKNSEDMLRCAFCEFAATNWNRGDNVWELHAAFVPTCLHLLCCKGLEYVKMVLKDGCDTESLSGIADRSMYAQHIKPQDLTILGISGFLLKKQNSTSASPSSQSGSPTVYKTYRGVPFRYPKHMDMIDPKDRLESFSKIYSLYGMMFDLKVLAEAGFYFTGDGDSVRCYHCGEGFKNWNRTDDPWIEHARHVPHCMHVILTKGEEFVEKVQNDIHGQLKRCTPTNTGVDKRKLESEDEDDIPGHDRKKFKVYGLVESSGVERCRQGDNGPVTVSHARRLQRCSSCREAKQEQWNMQELKLRAFGNRSGGESVRRSTGNSEDRDPPFHCAICHGNTRNAVGSVCCHVVVCESCCKAAGQCPVCGRT